MDQEKSDHDKGLVAKLKNYEVFESPSGVYRCAGCSKVLSEVRNQADDNTDALVCEFEDCSLRGVRHEYMTVLETLANQR